MQDNDLRFDEWNIKKKKLAKTKPKNKPQVKGIYWINMGLNLGSEVYGKGKVFQDLFWF